MVLFRNQYDLPAINFYASFDDLNMLLKEGEIVNSEEQNKAIEFQIKMSDFARESNFGKKKMLRNKIIFYANKIGRLRTLILCPSLMCYGELNPQIEALLNEFNISEPEDLKVRLTGYQTLYDESVSKYKESEDDGSPIDDYHATYTALESMLGHAPDSKMSLFTFIKYMPQLEKWLNKRK